MSAMTLRSGARGPLPPHRVFRNFLNEDEHAALLHWATASEELLAPSTLGTGGNVYLEHRGSRSLFLKERLGPWKDMLRNRLRAAMPELFVGAGLKPFEVSRFELELVVYGDGAHFARHVDTMRAGAPSEADRLLTGVYYFHTEPRAFSGGELRLFRFGDSGAAPGDFVDIAPEQNSLVVFPSWASHEVRPVHCPGGAYRDSRFSVNCWLERARPRAG